jgi:hypothetical protein
MSGQGVIPGKQGGTTAKIVPAAEENCSRDFLFS